MRIAFDVSAALVSRTGVGTYILNLCEELKSLPELDISLWALALRSKPLPPSMTDLPFRRMRIPGRLGPRMWSRVRFPHGELLTRAADVIHGTNFWVPPLSNKRGVVTIHDLTFIHHPELCPPTVRDYKKTLPIVLKSCGAVITISETVRKDFLEHFEFPEERVIVTLLGVHEWARKASPDPDANRALGIDGEYILFIGGQEPRKNLKALIRAFPEVEKLGVKLVLVGPEGRDSQLIEKEVERLSLQRSVIFAGRLSDQQLGSVLAGARAFVFPSLDEGFGMPPLEAMAAGVPVVAARAGALPEVLGEAPYWCDPLDESSIASALERALTDEPARSAAIARGRERAEKFTWARCAERTLEAYRIASA